MKFPLLPSFLLATISFSATKITTLIIVSDAYIIAPGAVPPGRQMQWLKQMTTDLCQQKVGELSSVQVSQSRELMYEWSHNPKLHTSDCDAAIAVESLLKRVVDEQNAIKIAASSALEELSETTKDSPISPVQVTVQDYNCVLEGWARTAASSSSSNSAMMAAERCEQIIDGMMQYGPYPDLTSFKACLMAWRQTVNHNSAKSAKDTPEVASAGPYRAQRLLELMIRLSSSDESRNGLLPDGDCFDIVLQTWSRSYHSEAPRQTELLLGVMDKLHRETGNEQLRPRQTSLNAVLTAWARSTDHVNAPKRAASILEYMELRANDGDVSVQPDGASYNIVMNAFAHSPDQVWAAKKADSFVQSVVARYKQNSNPMQSDSEPQLTRKEHNKKTTTRKSLYPVIEYKFEPNTILFNTAMGLWGKAKNAATLNTKSSKRISKSYRKARAILDMQVDLYENHGCRTCRPDVFGFTSVIMCCSAASQTVEEKEDAFQVALRTYRQIQVTSERDRLKYVSKYGREPSEDNTSSYILRPNHVTYGAMLKACANLLPSNSPLRRDLVQEIFQDCQFNGYVGDMVISQLREAAADPAMYKELMEGWSRKNIPSTWCRNVNEQSEYRTNPNRNNNNNNKSQQKRSNSARKGDDSNRKRAEV
jgi:hypothetical protein